MNFNVSFLTYEIFLIDISYLQNRKILINQRRPPQLAVAGRAHHAAAGRRRRLTAADGFGQFGLDLLAGLPRWPTQALHCWHQL